jgi:hypothetical protein
MADLERSLSSGTAQLLQARRRRNLILCGIIIIQPTALFSLRTYPGLPSKRLFVEGNRDLLPSRAGGPLSLRNARSNEVGDATGAMRCLLSAAWDLCRRHC